MRRLLSGWIDRKKNFAVTTVLDSKARKQKPNLVPTDLLNGIAYFCRSETTVRMIN